MHHHPRGLSAALVDQVFYSHSDGTKLWLTWQINGLSLGRKMFSKIRLSSSLKPRQSLKILPPVRRDPNFHPCQLGQALFCGCRHRQRWRCGWWYWLWPETRHYWIKCSTQTQIALSLSCLKIIPSEVWTQQRSTHLKTEGEAHLLSTSSNVWINPSLFLPRYPNLLNSSTPNKLIDFWSCGVAGLNSSVEWLPLDARRDNLSLDMPCASNVSLLLLFSASSVTANMPLSSSCVISVMLENADRESSVPSSSSLQFPWFGRNISEPISS